MYELYGFILATSIIISSIIAMIPVCRAVANWDHHAQRVRELEKVKAELSDMPKKIEELEAWNEAYSESLSIEYADGAVDRAKIKAEQKAWSDYFDLSNGKMKIGYDLTVVWDDSRSEWRTREGITARTQARMGISSKKPITKDVWQKTSPQPNMRILPKGAKLTGWETTDSDAIKGMSGLRRLRAQQVEIVENMRTIADAAQLNERSFTYVEEEAWLILEANLDAHDRKIQKLATMLEGPKK